MLKVQKVPKESLVFAAGVRPGDQISSVNGNKITDELDFAYYTAEQYLTIEVIRNKAKRSIEIERESGVRMDIEFYDIPINRCTNRCIFCFIDQMPKGLRKGLYIKDEDYKHSFLNGNYVTLSGVSEEDLDKIVAIGLSPLFISVHATDKTIRNTMLRNRKAPDIIEQLGYLAQNGIAFHTQIVLCPGFNDGAVLKRTIKDLFSFDEMLLSIAVVPVGLTKYHTYNLEPVSIENAEKICTDVSVLSEKQYTRDGIRRLFLSDEFFIKAGVSIPPKKYYEDYPQIENGIGLVRQLMENWSGVKRKLKKSQPLQKQRSSGAALVCTSVSAFPFVNKVVKEIGAIVDRSVQCIAVENTFFGNRVTVAGLLSAKDIMSTFRKYNKEEKLSCCILPSVMFNYAGFTLDGYAVPRLEKELGVKVLLAGNGEELLGVME